VRQRDRKKGMERADPRKKGNRIGSPANSSAGEGEPRDGGGSEGGAAGYLGGQVFIILLAAVRSLKSGEVKGTNDIHDILGYTYTNKTTLHKRVRRPLTGDNERILNTTLCERERNREAVVGTLVHRV